MRLIDLISLISSFSFSSSLIELRNLTVLTERAGDQLSGFFSVDAGFDGDLGRTGDSSNECLVFLGSGCFPAGSGGKIVQVMGVGDLTLGLFVGDDPLVVTPDVGGAGVAGSPDRFSGMLAGGDLSVLASDVGDFNSAGLSN